MATGAKEDGTAMGRGLTQMVTNTKEALFMTQGTGKVSTHGETAMCTVESFTRISGKER